MVLLKDSVLSFKELSNRFVISTLNVELQLTYTKCPHFTLGFFVCCLQSLYFSAAFTFDVSYSTIYTSLYFYMFIPDVHDKKKVGRKKHITTCWAALCKKKGEKGEMIDER